MEDSFNIKNVYDQIKPSDDLKNKIEEQLLLRATEPPAKSPRRAVYVAVISFLIIILFFVIAINTQMIVFGDWPPATSSETVSLAGKTELMNPEKMASIAALSIDELLSQNAIIIRGTVIGIKNSYEVRNNYGNVTWILTPVTIKISEVISSGGQNLGSEIDFKEVGGVTDQFYMKTLLGELNVSDDVIIIMSNKTQTAYGSHNIYIISDENTVTVYKFLFRETYPDPSEWESTLELDADDFVEMIKDKMTD